MEEKVILKQFSMFLRSNSLEAGPPLTTILGNLGINTTKFCSEFNDFTKSLPNYFLLKINITIFSDKTFIFVVNKPTSTFLLRLLSYEKSKLIKKSGGEKVENTNVVKLRDIFEVCYFIYNDINDANIKSLCGTLNSMNLFIDDED